MKLIINFKQTRATSAGDLNSPNLLVSNYDPRLILTYFTPRSNLVTKAFVWAKVKIIFFYFFLENIAVIGLNVG